jgi:hypothetical protein
MRHDRWVVVHSDSLTIRVGFAGCHRPLYEGPRRPLSSLIAIGHCPIIADSRVVVVAADGNDRILDEVVTGGARQVAVLSVPLMAAMAVGRHTALVVDIGHRTTTITPIIHR